MPTLACWWLSIHFDEYLVLCGYSHYIFGQLVSFVDYCIFGLCSHYFLELCVNVILIKCKCIVLGTLRN